MGQRHEVELYLQLAHGEMVEGVMKDRREEEEKKKGGEGEGEEQGQRQGEEEREGQGQREGEEQGEGQGEEQEGERELFSFEEEGSPLEASADVEWEEVISEEEGKEEKPDYINNPTILENIF